MRSRSLRQLWQRRAAGVSLAVAAGLLAACASPTDGGPAVPVEPSAVQNGAEITQANFAQAITDAQQGLTSMRMAMTITSDMLVEDAVAGRLAAVAQVDLTPPTPSMAVSMSMLSADMEMIVVGDTWYLDVSGEGMFISMNIDDLAGDDGLSSLTEQFETDLGAQAQAFAEAITSFEQSGIDTIEDTEVTVFTMTVDPALLGTATGVRDGTVGEGIIDSMVVTYALDADNLPRAVTITMSVDGQEMTISTLITDINAPLTIAAPRPDQVIAFNDL